MYVFFKYVLIKIPKFNWYLQLIFLQILEGKNIDMKDTKK